jgi:two-component system KDP operon response regulator KdpE
MADLQTPQDAPTLHALVIEDEPAIRHLVRDALRRQGLHVTEADGIATALSEAAQHAPDLVILDLGLKDGDGLSFIQAFRLWSQRPVLVLSARQTESDKIHALDLGADDYLSKPFSMGELLARIRALTRRRERMAQQNHALFQFGGVEVDLSRHTVKRHGVAVHLTAIEFRLLAVLLNQAGKVLTHHYLLREVWGMNHMNDSHYLRVYIGHLRQKLEDNPTLPTHLHTEIGVGYRLILE